MKKLSLFCLLVLVVTLSFAQKGKLDIDWESVQTIKYPIPVVATSKVYDGESITLVRDTSYIMQPNDLSIYCLNQSEKYISGARMAFQWSTGLTIAGGLFTGVGALLTSNYHGSYTGYYGQRIKAQPGYILGETLIVSGGIMALASVICDVVCINDLFQFAKWNHREKAVQFTVKPTGVALSF